MRSFVAANAARLKGEPSEAKRLWKENTRAARRLTGMCVACGKVPAMSGYWNGKKRVSCADCSRHGQRLALGLEPTNEEAFNARMLAAGRCRCGLLNPCWNCGPTAVELATARPGGDTYPESVE